MSTPALELALWRLGNMPHDVEAFRADPDGWLQAFRLDAEERVLVKDLDLRRLADRQVNEMLLMAAFRALRSSKEMPDYMRQMNTPAH